MLLAFARGAKSGTMLWRWAGCADFDIFEVLFDVVFDALSLFVGFLVLLGVL